MDAISLKKIISIVEYGKYSLPILNYIMGILDKKSHLNLYIELLKAKWKNKHNLALKYANIIISTTTTTILKELTRFEKIKILIILDKRDYAKKEYFYLKKNFSLIPEYARNLILPGLKHLISIYNDDLGDINICSNKYNKSYVQMSLLKYSEARKFRDEKKYDEAYKKAIEGYILAKEFSHPTMMCSGLNNAAWWVKNIDKKKSLYIANLLEYYLGYYFEDLQKMYNQFDTIFEIYFMNNNIGIFDITDNIYKLHNKYPDFKIGNKFNKFIFIDNIKTYELTKNLNDFISKKIQKECYHSSKKSSELKKIIDDYNLSFNSNYPFAINNEIYKIHLKNNFNNNIAKFKTIARNKIPKLFFSTYTALIEKPYFTKSRILRLIFEGDKDKIIKYFSRDYEKMYFFNLMLSEFEVKEIEKRIMNPDDFEEIKSDVSPFFVSRKKLITELFKNVRNFKEFILHYFELSDEEMRIFDVFLRNCVRYDIKWPITPYPKGKIKNFAIKYGLGYKRVALGYYSFEDNERELFDSIIEKFLSV
ncbi:hypothetical protein [Marinitoga sp. 38H-ov]|uniref:hypothetical protein n=1 Tax=Marinitoga sp. 38H-ov TaxID=1755814 RepID=UPI0013EBC22D|nr:hypothetical protein [Marinitoga sp. 38H-ov]KAF2956879.1 hypothetical protein AS160_03775 [Marinitoga sp. 38H-ov]